MENNNDDGIGNDCTVEREGTNRRTVKNKQAVKIKNEKDTKCCLIDVAMPSDRNVVQNEAENKRKYKYINSTNLEHEILCYTNHHWDHRNCR